MRVTNEEFITKFHSLTGTTIGEQRKNFFTLLNKIQLESTELDFSSLQPKTPLEEKFKVEALIHFKRIPDLIEVLKCENPLLIKRVLKVDSWFWEQAFQDVTGEQLATQLFPYISFNVKVKILNRLSPYLNSQKADEYFKAVQAKYGLYLASKLFVSCSSDLIVGYIKENKIKPSSRQLLGITKQKPEILEVILKILSVNLGVNVENEYKNVILYLASHDFALFLKLHQEYKFSMRVGWRITDKFIRANKGKVITSPREYYNFLHNKQIAKSVHGDFGELYLNFFAKNLKDFDNDWCWSVIKNLPTKLKNPQLYLTTFEKAYGFSLWDKLPVKFELLKMLTPDQREVVMKADRPYFYSEDDWNCYWKTEKSVPFYKKKISLTSDISTRADLMELLVKTCALNADTEALARVCYYMLTKHRNDSIAVRLAFLKTVNSKFNLENLEDKHWTYLRDILQLFELNNETFYEADYFLMGYIRYRSKNNLPVKEQLTEWLKLKPYRMNVWHGKPVLLMCGEIIPEIFADEDLVRMSLNFLISLIDWNKQNKNDEISLFKHPKAIENFKRAFDLHHFVYGCSTEEIMQYLVRLETDSEEKINLLNFCLQPNNHITEKVIKQFVVNQQSLVIQNIESVTQIVLKLKLKDNSFFWKFCRNFSHLEIPQKVTSIVLNACKEQSDKLIIENSITALSYLMPTEEFLAFSVPYQPANLQIDKDQIMTKIQEQIGLNFRNLLPASTALNNIMLFSKTHSLKLIRNSLYSLCYNVNEDKLAPFINQLAERTVLVSKHALHLTFSLLDTTQKYNILHLFMKIQKKPFVRRFMFKTLFNSFTKNPSEYSWELLKSNISGSEENFKKLFDTWMKADKFPAEYKIPYLIFTWQMLHNLPKVDESVNNYRAAVLKLCTPEIIQLLPKEFSYAVINEYFFKCGEIAALNEAIERFTCNYVIYCTDPIEQDGRLRSIFGIMKNYILESRKCALNFLKTFCQKFLTDNCFNRAGLIRFAELWNELLKPHQAFDEYLHLQFTLIYSEKSPLNQIAQKLANLCDELTATYGPTIVDLFGNKLNFFTKYFVGGEGDEFERNLYILIENFIKPDSSVACLLLVILLLNSNGEPNTTEGMQKNETIVEMLQKTENPVILLYLNRHFRGSTSLDYH